MGKMEAGTELERRSDLYRSGKDMYVVHKVPVRKLLVEESRAHVFSFLGFWF